MNDVFDIGTYGKTDAAKTLARILNKRDNPKLNRKVGHIWDECVAILMSIEQVSNPRNKISLANLLRDHMMKTIRSRRFPKEVRSYLTNIVVGRFRDFFERNPSCQRQRRFTTF